MTFANIVPSKSRAVITIKFVTALKPWFGFFFALCSVLILNVRMHSRKDD